MWTISCFDNMEQLLRFCRQGRELSVAVATHAGFAAQHSCLQLRFFMASKRKQDSGLDREANDTADDLAMPGEVLEQDDELRQEINIDREMWNRQLS